MVRSYFVALVCGHLALGIAACKLPLSQKSTVLAENPRDPVTPRPQYASFCEWYIHRDEVSAGARNTIDQVMVAHHTCAEAAETITIVLRFNDRNIDLAPIATLHKLDEVILKVWDFIPDLSPLGHVKILSQVDVDGHNSPITTGFKNFASLPQINRLTFVHFNFNGETAWLKDMKNFAQLDIDGSDFGDKDIKSLMPLYMNLRSLSLSGSKITDLAAMGILVNLTSLSLNDNPQLKNILDVSYLTNLQSLQMVRNAISDVTPIANLKSLKALYLSNNQIRSIDALASLPNLNNLILMDNPIADLSPLERLPNLRTLFVTGTTAAPNGCPSSPTLAKICPSCGVH